MDTIHSPCCLVLVGEHKQTTNKKKGKKISTDHFRRYSRHVEKITQQVSKQNEPHSKKPVDLRVT
jgi:ribosome recycling factor